MSELPQGPPAWWRTEISLRGALLFWYGVRMDNMEKSYFRTGRFFHQQSIGGDSEDGWYLMLRGGAIEGPFTSRYQALVMLKNLLKAYEEIGDKGGREGDS